MARTPDTSSIMREIKLLRGDIKKLQKQFNADARANDRLLTVKEAARIINKSTDYIYGLIRTGRLGTTRNSPKGNHRISENEIRKYLYN